LGGGVTDVPEVHYVRSADGINLAYHVTGEGPLDLVVLGGGSAIPLDLMWDDAEFIRITKRLGRFCRTLWFQTRGWGASEGNSEDNKVGVVSDADLVAVLDDSAFERPALLGALLSGGLAIGFAARHPERVSALVLFNTHAHYVREDDYPWGFPRESLDRLEALIRESWGTEVSTEYLAPSRIDDARYKSWFARSARVGGGPDQIARAVRANFEVDQRKLLPSISVPTIVLHREDNRLVRIGAGRYLAEHIPAAKFVALAGDEFPLFMGDTDSVVDEIEEFLTGSRSGADADSITATILFTDIVASTERQARVGPQEWSRICERHDAIVREALARHRGREVKTTGDGFLATFDSTGRAIRCASDILGLARGIGLNLRAGIHTGEIEVRGDDIAGLAVTIANRVCDLAGAGELLISRTVADLVVGSGFECEDKGERELKGVPGTWRLFRVKS
jgi:class 3 adenylate cyclase